MASPSSVGDPARQCHGKERFVSKAEAKRTKQRLRGYPGRDTVGVYCCPHCGYYHIGRKKPSP